KELSLSDLSMEEDDNSVQTQVNSESIVDGLIRQLYGTLKITGKEEKGWVFELKIPQLLPKKEM
ncbi:MAG: hypothetical protein HUK25_00975, partial [Treponema sp.]|nr:hypothetical protein [Treponema sp.]